jgi:uncharacterized membrane protein required for colicin V production
MSYSPICSLATVTSIAPALLASPGAGSTRWIDALGVALVLLFACFGAMRGLWWQMVRLCGVIAAISVARAFAPRAAPRVESWFPGLGAGLANGLVWTLVLGAGMLVVALVGKVGKAAIDAVQLSTFDRLGGACAGALSGLLIHAALVIAASQVAPRSWTAKTIERTHSQAWVGVLHRAIPGLLDPLAREALAAERGSRSGS